MTTLSERLREGVDPDNIQETEEAMDKAATALDAKDALLTKAEQVLGHFRTAWDSLPSGNHSPNIIERWLRDKMKPAIDAARTTIAKLEASNAQPTPPHSKESPAR